MGSFFRFCQDLCSSRDDDLEMLAWMCKTVECEGSIGTMDWGLLGLRSTWSLPPPQWAVDREAAGEEQQDIQEYEVKDGVKEDEVKVDEVKKDKVNEDEVKEDDQ